jgi:hypothetical protein
VGVFLYKKSLFREIPYKSEAALEAAIHKVKEELFGPNRVYLDIKRKIGAKGKQRNIPDGYLIDLNSKQPKLYVVENELSTHDHLRHIAVQILQFSMAFEDEPLRVRDILFDAISKNNEIHSQLEGYIKKREFRNLDHLLDFLVHEAEFAALVIIDDIPENLENVLASKFAFGVEILELKQYEDEQKQIAYGFAPFLEDVNVDIAEAIHRNKQTTELDASEIDTVVIPARKEGFQRVFLGEDSWYAIRLHGSMRPQIKYIAAYQVSPVSAITHMAPVANIEPWKDSGKYIVHFSEPAEEIGPIKLKKQGRVKAPQNLRYTTRERLLAAKTLDDIW